MRLQTKKEINQLKSVQQTQLAQEGLKLAQRVDRLREVASDEEAALERFRRETLATIHEEISEETKIRDTLRHEVSVLKREREEALKPLTEEENRLKQERERLLGLEDRISDDRHKLEVRESDLDKRDRALGRSERQLLSRSSAVDASLKESEQIRQDAKIAFSFAQALKKEVEEGKERVENELHRKAVELGERESALSIAEEHARKEAERLKKEWILLEDRKRMLERQIIRSNK